MTYPPQFSDTLTYENRLDLDKINVFLQGDDTNPMFFDVTGLPRALSFGKHYFNISLLDFNRQDYILQRNSRIIFEFKSVNNVVLKSDVTSVNQKNGVILAYVEVLKDPLRTYEFVEDGPGTLNICAILTNKLNARRKIPNHYLDKINYRCTWPIDVRKNLINANSPTVVQSEHKISTTLGQFSFIKASLSTRKNATIGNTYGPAGKVQDSEAVPPGTE